MPENIESFINNNNKKDDSPASSQQQQHESASRQLNMNGNGNQHLFSPESNISQDGTPNASKASTCGGGGILSILPPLFSTIIGSGEVPNPRIWNILRTSPAVLPFLPTWFLRESLLKIAMAAKQQQEDIVANKEPQDCHHQEIVRPGPNVEEKTSVFKTKEEIMKEQQQHRKTRTTSITADADRWTQADDWASLGCLMFWLRTGRPVHAEKDVFVSSSSPTTNTHSDQHQQNGSNFPFNSNAASSPEIHKLHHQRNDNNSNHNASSSTLSQYVASLIETLEDVDRLTVSSWHSVLSQYAIAPTLSEWNWRVLKNINSSSSSSTRHSSSSSSSKKQSNSKNSNNASANFSSLISPIERNLLLRLLQLPESQQQGGTNSNNNTSSNERERNSNNNTNNHQSSSPFMINGIPVVFDNQQNNSSSRSSSSRNTTPRGNAMMTNNQQGTTTTCRNTEPPSATDILLHPYFAHVNWLDVFNQDPNCGVTS